jgi:hypothetical protein
LAILKPAPDPQGIVGSLIGAAPCLLAGLGASLHCCCHPRKFSRLIVSFKGVHETAVLL